MRLARSVRYATGVNTYYYIITAAMTYGVVAAVAFMSYCSVQIGTTIALESVPEWPLQSL